MAKLNPFKNKDVILIKDFTRDDLFYLFQKADKIERMPERDRICLLNGKILGYLFFEPSTRTRLSFEAAMLWLGGRTLGFAEPKVSSVEKGESLADTIRTVENYVDVIVMRHSKDGAASFAAEIASKPLINGGSGTEEHPTQAMLDLYTIIKEKGSIDNLKIGLLGDLKYGRTVYSLLYGLSKFNVEVKLISHPILRVRREIFFDLEKKVKISEHDNLEEILPDLDVLYVTRIQKERFPDLSEYERVKSSYNVNLKILQKAKDDLIILHPFPRIDEISPEVDSSPHAKYFKQMLNGRILRSALLASILDVPF
ncbi:MAG: aspartate carbamoyltransferase [Nitrososphaeria archaeon]